MRLENHAWRDCECSGTTSRVEGGAMKAARGAWVYEGGAEARSYDATPACTETFGAAAKRAEPETARTGLAEAWRSCGAFEWVTMAYLGWVLAFLAMFHRNIPDTARYFAIHAAIVAAIVSLAWIAARSRSAVLQFARHWYPLPLYIFFFEELRGFVHAIFPGWFDRWLIQFDYNLAGVHPAAWMARFATPALSDFMQFSYMTYFLYLVILPAILYMQGKRAAFWTVMVSTAIAHYSVYVIAVLFPVESPYFALASLNLPQLRGGAFTTTIEFIERFGRVHGAA